MMWFLKVFFLVVIVALPLSAEPHLILHFDINGTLIASDKAGNKTVGDMLNALLAEKYAACWDDSILEPITFDSYVREFLVPGAKDDLLLKAERTALLSHFLDYLHVHNHSLYPSVKSNYDFAMSHLNASNRIVFSSFYHMIDELDKMEISYSIILRSFGHEVFEVRDEMDGIFGGMFHQSGKFRAGSLYLDEEHAIDDHGAIYHAIRHSGHMAIHDDWNHWTNQGMRVDYAKPFLIDMEDPTTLSIFFDDNIRLGNPDTNIISPRNMRTSESIPIDDLVKSKQAVRVDTLEAILNEDYFLNCVKAALESHSLNFQHSL